MRFLDFLCPALLAFSLHIDHSVARKPNEAILLSNVNTLTVRKGLKTSHRRVSAIPQLKCVGGNAKGLYEVDIIRCRNQGHDYDEANVQWTCTASLPSEFKLGSTDVICEGYESPNDPYILKGSCGVEYRLVLTDIGEEKYGHKKDDLWNGYKGKGANGATILFWLIFVGVLAWIIYSAYIRAPRGAIRRGPGGNGGRWGGGGGGGGGPGDDPPPPYDYHPKPSSSTNPAPQQGWRPGFWTGTLGGAAAGYMAGQRGQSQRNQGVWGGQQNGDRWGNTDPGEGSSRWGGGSGRVRSSGGSSYSSTRHESSGFGSTSRRETDYTSDAINAAAQEALQLASQGQTLGRDRYPHVYNDYEHFQFSHAQKPYLEFPVIADGSVYDGESPGADRVVIGSIAEDYSNAVYCAVITHDGERKNGFAEC
ncbi:MAG: hypothetical protein MMC33_004328 [Icmadophila ericetorum]|nr:hypothetical protein [Icmadophila ericetorum]